MALRPAAVRVLPLARRPAGRSARLPVPQPRRHHRAIKTTSKRCCCRFVWDRRHAFQDNLEHCPVHVQTQHRKLPSDLTGNSLLTQNVGRHEQEPCSGVVILGTILLIILILILIGALPTWPYSGGWGYYPSGGFGLLLVIVVILLLMGRI